MSSSDSPPEPANASWDAADDRAIRRDLIQLAWPIAVSMVSYSVMTLADTLFVGRLGPASIAGVGLGGVAAFTIVCFIIGLLQGSKVLVSQAVGAGRPHLAARHAGAAMVVAVALGLVALVVGIGVAQLLPLLTASAESGLAARDYLAVRMIGSPIVMLYVASREVRYGLGDSRSPMVASVTGNLTNIGLDALFIFGLELGVAGAAWATVVGQLVELAVLLGLARRRVLARPLAADLRALFSIGIPTGLQLLLEVGSFALLTALLAAFAEREMAAHQIAIQVLHFSFLPTIAVGEASSVLVGRAVGADRDDVVPRIARAALRVAGSYAALCTLVLLTLSEPLARAFTDDAPLVATTRTLLLIAAGFQIVDALNVIGRSVLRGAGDVRWSAVVGVVTAWLCTPPLTLALGYGLGLGAAGGWVGLCAEIAIGAALIWHRVLRGRWIAAEMRRRDAESGATLDAGILVSA